MTFQHRVQAFIQLGSFLQNAATNAHKAIVEAYLYNNWFTEESQRLALQAWADTLTEQKINTWVSKYQFTDESSNKSVAIIMAGNIPLVGLHDLVCVLLAGHKAIIKLSSDDNILPKFIVAALIQIEPAFADKITVLNDEKLGGNYDAVIATGSNNSNRYFEYYFRKLPNILRRNRNSIAVLTGHETNEDMKLLAKDIFTYFGLGCRNVSKLYIPRDFDMAMFFENTHDYDTYMHHNKYANNYTYHKAIWLLNQDQFLENGLINLKESKDLASPLASVYYEYYDTLDEVKSIIEERKEDIQCIVSKIEIGNSIPLGKSQQPELWDYADGIDTLAFLLKL
ncbi:MAG: acyl-CoA reductase [Bacteroidota bacterium]